MDRQELNRQIRLVLEKHKKDVPDAHKTVKEAGYGIYRKNGAFIVWNPKTNRELDGGSWYKWQFDFVGYLEKPKNNYKLVKDIQNRPIGEAKNKARELLWAKHEVEYYDRQIAEWKKDIKHCFEQIERYQDNILREKLRKQKAELRVEEFKKELREKYLKGGDVA